ncbi:uncharacterized protein LOC144541935 [Centroberyx gerrardi]
METLPVRRKASCLLRIRENCPFRRLRRNKYDVSAASSAIGPYWSDLSPSANNQPVSTVYSEPLPPLPTYQNVYIPHQSQVAIVIHMDLDSAAADRSNLPNPQHRHTEDSMELDSGVDPETGERAQG